MSGIIPSFSECFGELEIRHRQAFHAHVEFLQVILFEPFFNVNTHGCATNIFRWSLKSTDEFGVLQVAPLGPKLNALSVFQAEPIGRLKSS